MELSAITRAALRSSKVQRNLIPAGDGRDEVGPVLLGYANLSIVAKEQVAEGCRLGFTLFRLGTHPQII